MVSTQCRIYNIPYCLLYEAAKKVTSVASEIPPRKRSRTPIRPRAKEVCWWCHKCDEVNNIILNLQSSISNIQYLIFKTTYISHKGITIKTKVLNRALQGNCIALPIPMWSPFLG